jgi:hypothetical protein
MKKPTNLKEWEFVKSKPHNISSIQSPQDYYYQLTNGVFYPAVSVHDWFRIQNLKR